jgi:NAD-dependent dihydropyrimidine dehydrogenase PreA subunit
MEREMVKIDEELCNGCGACVPGCHEGALQIIDGKARLISDLLCDGLGACIGHCPEGAITVEKREAEPYDEVKVMELMVDKGLNTVVAHLKHLKDHNETTFLKQGVAYLKEHANELSFNVDDVIRKVHQPKLSVMNHAHNGGGCPGSQERVITRGPEQAHQHVSGETPSELRQWPVQMHLINPAASYFQESDLVLAADCVAFSMGNFHSKYLKGRSLAIACPKLDDGQNIYHDKLVRLIEESRINTLTVVIMQVPCCMGLLQTARQAMAAASRKIPLKLAVISVEGEVLKEEWV